MYLESGRRWNEMNIFEEIDKMIKSNEKINRDPTGVANIFIEATTLEGDFYQFKGHITTDSLKEIIKIIGNNKITNKRKII